MSAAGTTMVKNADDKMESIAVTMVKAGDELSKTTAELRMILQKVNAGKGSLAKILNDGKLYENLLENTHQLEALLEEVKAFVEYARQKGVPLKLK